jgi:pimeloyl-ACP methyl ester carboxylesterase
MKGELNRKKTAVLIHGLSETRKAWRRQVPFLRRSADVIAYDVRGFGASPAGSADGTVRQMADDLAQVISAKEAGPVCLVGFSMGGVIAQRFALDFADLTEGLVLIASSSTIGRAGEQFFRDRIEQVAAGGLEALASINSEDARGCFAMGDEQLISEYQQLRVDAVHEVEGYLNACRAMMGIKDKSLTQNLGAIKCPVLVIAGELDPYCPPRASEMIATAIPKAELRVIPNAGHCVHWEAADETNELIYGFMNGKGAKNE